MPVVTLVMTMASLEIGADIVGADRLQGTPLNYSDLLPGDQKVDKKRLRQGPVCWTATSDLQATVSRSCCR